MPTEIDRLLAERLARLAGTFGAPGARFVGLRLPVNHATRTLTVRADLKSVLGVLRGLVAEVGDVIAWPPDPDADDTIAAIVGTGRGALNPALIVATTRTTQDGGVVVTLKGHAKEGWIKQRGGEEASGRLMSLFRARLGQHDPNIAVHTDAPPN